MLNEQALEAAREQPGTNHDGIIRAYLSALSSAAVAEREPVAFTSDVALEMMRDHWPKIEVIGVSRFASPVNSVPLYLDPPPVSELEAENARLTKLLSVRDDFIVNQGLWGDFVATLPAARRVREGGKVDG